MARKRSVYSQFQMTHLAKSLETASHLVEREDWEQAHASLLEAVRCCCFLAASDGYDDGRKFLDGYGAAAATQLENAYRGAKPPLPPEGEEGQ